VTDEGNTEKRRRGRPRSVFSEPQAATVQALDRGLILLRDLARNDGAILSDLSLRLGMPASTAHRILATFQKHGFVELNDATQEWHIGIEAFRTGNTFLVRANLVEAARDVMHQLMEETGETANLGIMDQGDVVFISQVETHNPIRAFFRPGTRGHMHASGIGKALLADLPVERVKQILTQKGLPTFTDKTLTSPDALLYDLEVTRSRGWSLDDEERYSGMRCVAAGIYNVYGEVAGGISVSGPTVRFPDTELSGLGAIVRKAADEVTRSIGGKRPTR